MQNVVYNPRGAVPSEITAILPTRLKDEIVAFAAKNGTPEEIRLRRERVASLTKDGRNFALSTVLSGKETDDILLSLCEGSLYAHEDTIKKGYIAFRGGVRVGVCGRATPKEDGVGGVFAVSALVLRLPCPVPDAGEEIVALLDGGAAGVLLYAPPGVGKTTCLRAVVKKAAASRRVALVDTREELSSGLSSPQLLLDVLSAYPRHVGIVIAVRTLSAQLIVCDEIGGEEDARALLDGGAGVPVLASAHASDLSALLKRRPFSLMHAAGIFDTYVGLRRRDDAFGFSYDIHSREEADALLGRI